MRISAIEVRSYRIAWDPPFRAAWDPVPRTHQDAAWVIVRTDEGLEGCASGDFAPDRALLERFLVGVDPFRTETVREVVETVDFHGGRNWTVEAAVWDLVGRAVGQPVSRLLGGRQERLIAYASTGELVDPDERARRAVALRDAGVRALKLRFHHADWRRDVDVVEHVRAAVGPDVEIMVDANQGWRMPGDTEPRWDVPTAIRAARALERCGVYWLEEPLRTDDVEGYRELRRKTDLRLAAGEMVRSIHEARDLLVRGGIDVAQPDVVLTGGIGGCRRLAALADLLGRGWSPHTWSNGAGLVANLHAACGVSTVPYVEVPHDPPAWSAVRRDWVMPGTLVEIAADGTVAPPPGPGLGVVPDWDVLEQHRVGVSAMGSIEMRAAVLREPGTPLVVERVVLDPPGPGEVRVRVAAAGVCHSDLHLADGVLGEGRHPIVLGHEGAGVVDVVGEGVQGLAPGDPVAFTFIPPCGACKECRAGRWNMCVQAGAASYGGRMLDGTRRLRALDGTELQHGLLVACFAEHTVIPAAAAVRIPPELPLWQAALVGCGVMTGFGAVRNVARVGIGDTVAVVGCGGVGLQVIAAARLAGALRIVALDRDGAKLQRALEHGATDAVDTTEDGAAARVLALTDGGVDHAFEVVGLPQTIRLAWDVLRLGGTAVVVGLAPVGVEASVPAIEFLADKSLKGCYYGSGNVLVELPQLARMAVDGRIDLAGVVSHLTTLDGIQAAFERMRRGEGARTVAIIDADLAGAPGHLAVG